MTKNRIKILSIAIMAVFVFAIASVNRNTAQATSRIDDTAEATYKAKCAMCHSPKAEKSYDPAVAIEEQVEAILKGKKGEKPPNMPAFEAKGITPEQAKALAEYMKSLRTPAN